MVLYFDWPQSRRNSVESNTSRNYPNNPVYIFTAKGPLPVIVIIGDGLHNFGDGLAIGAAFLAGIGPGLSTSLAVFCHELPHELGDIAILLKSGISLKWALVLNFVSALTCVAGLVVGFIVGVTLEARQWIFAVTAGTFLYIGLADMLPQLLRFRDSDNPKLMFCLINIGFLCGMAIIVVIALYEDAILVKL
ncbi:zinc transporter ZIP4-like [Apostichopus japonicus]|uniref:zinc transporter ZIP4-like n=1 Tax=Stichopus japonicus TaxID=307972 RepID=UPI003AB36129